MSSIITQSGEAVPLALILEDGNTSKFPQAKVYDAVGSAVPVSTVDLTHLTLGYYYASYVVPSASKFTVVYTVFDDVGRTVISPAYTRAQDILIADIPEAAPLTEAHLNVAYNDNTQLFTAAIWMDRNGATVVSPTSSTIVLRDQSGAIVFTLSSSTPLSNGVFLFQQPSVSLVDINIYYVAVTVVDAVGTVTTNQTFTTVA